MKVFSRVSKAVRNALSRPSRRRFDREENIARRIGNDLSAVCDPRAGKGHQFEIEVSGIPQYGWVVWVWTHSRQGFIVNIRVLDKKHSNIRLTWSDGRVEPMCGVDDASVEALTKRLQNYIRTFGTIDHL